MCKCFRYYSWIQWAYCIYQVRLLLLCIRVLYSSVVLYNNTVAKRTPIRLSLLSSWWWYICWYFIFHVNNVEWFFNVVCVRYYRCFIDLANALYIVNQLLKVRIIVHGGSHLYRFCILSLLLLLLDYIWKHFFNSWVIGWLDNDARVVIINTSMSHMIIVILLMKCSWNLIFLESFSHIESLLTINSCSSWLLMSYIQYSTIGWETRLADSFCLCIIMIGDLLSFWFSLYISAAGENVELVIAAGYTIGGWSRIWDDLIYSLGVKTLYWVKILLSWLWITCWKVVIVMGNNDSLRLA